MLLAVVSDVLTTTLMAAADWLEYHRNRFLKALWPGAATALEASPLLHVVSSIRASGAVVVQATETFQDGVRTVGPQG